MREFAQAQKRNLLSDLHEILQSDRYTRFNYLNNFGDDRFKGLGLV